MQNIMAFLFILPFVVFVHVRGTENVVAALQMVVFNHRVRMTVIWLLCQMAAISFNDILLIRAMNSFWAVSLHSLRVVYWWCRQIFLFYIFSDVTLSVIRPTASVWSFALIIGALLVPFSIYIDYS